MLIKQSLYFKRHSTRKPEHLMKPRINRNGSFKFPENAILNYLPSTETELGPSASLPMFKAPRVVHMRHVTELMENKGNPKNNMVLPGPLIQIFRKANPSMRLISRWENADKDAQNLIVINYSILQRIRRYPKSAWSVYYKWYNIQSTVMQTMNDLAYISERQQFLMMEMPTELLDLATYRRHENGTTKQTIRRLKNEENYFLSDLFTWIGKKRENSMLSMIDEENYSKINIVFMLYGKWVLINLGLLNSWRKSPTQLKGLDPKVMQLRIIKLLNTFIEKGVVAEEEDSHVEMVESYQDDDETSGDEEEDDDSNDDILNQLDEIDNEEIDESDFQVGVLEEETDLDDEDDEGEVQLGDELDEDELPVEVVQKIENKIDEKIVIDRVTDLKHNKPEDTIVSKAEQLFKDKLITFPEKERLERLAKSYLEMDDPFGKDKSFAEALIIEPKEIKLQHTDRIPKMAVVKDKSMLHSTVEDMNEQYVAEVLNKDVMNSVMSFQKAGVAVTNYTVERETSAVNDFEVHTVSLVPAIGKPSTVRFSLPKVDKYGMYLSNGVRYRLKTQKIDVPIRKVSSVRVGITTHYAKLFIERSERVRFDEDAWIASQLFAIGTDASNERIFNLRASDVSDIRIKVPSIFSLISRRISYFKHEDMAFCFDHANRNKVLNRKIEDIEFIEKQENATVCGVSNRQFIIVDNDNIFYKVGKGTKRKVIGDIFDISNMDTSKRPLPMAELKLFGKTIPLGVVIAFLLGFHPMLEKLNVEYRTTFPGERLNLGKDEFAIRFSDRTYIFNRKDDVATMLLSGFVMYGAGISDYSVYSFDKRSIYLNVFEHYNVGVRYTKEFALMHEMLIDPVSKDILKEMKEPTEVPELFIRAADMLKDRYVPDKTEHGNFDGLERAVGYERFSRAVYSEMIKSIRRLNSRQVVSNGQVTMNPFAVSMVVLTDPAKELINDINPIHNLKEKEAITYGGSGGRGRRSMTADDRLFQKSDLGFISEAGVDSGDVGIITYVTPNANFTSVRGTVRHYDKSKDGASSLLGTSSLLLPMIDRDDPKRANFGAIQNSHGISSVGNTTMPIRTGYEDILAHRVDPLWANPSEQPGKVTKVDKDHIEVKYKDGTIKAFPLGRVFGTSTGTQMPFTISTTFKEGDKFDEKQILTYNEDYFAPNPLAKGEVSWKSGTLAKVAISEAAHTFEDSSGISQELALRMASYTSEVKTIVVRFDQIVTDLVKVGDKVDLESILCYIEDSIDGKSIFDGDDSISGLSALSRMTPKAGMVGIVEKLEVFYHGDLEDMTDNLQVLCKRGDKERKRIDRMLGRTHVNGQVDQSLRINGNGLELDNIAIKVYMTKLAPMGVGDKLVLGNQLKSVNAVVFKEPVVSQRGTVIDMSFGNKSIDDRIVNSPKLLGSTCTLLRIIGDKAVDLYFS